MTFKDNIWDTDFAFDRAARLKYALAIGLSLMVSCTGPSPQAGDTSIDSVNQGNRT
ncbi:MAG: hypothetical protein HC800_24680 [Phormidesmis sp. RL_2_1]|nr:hypothetical protein [Phormidesmis sp. RL_2_1]